MSSVETDVQLNKMLLENKQHDVKVLTERLNDFLATYRQSWQQEALDLSALILGAEPLIKSISFTIAAGEYNDSGYDGLKVSDPYVSFTEDIKMKDGEGEYILEADVWHYAFDVTDSTIPSIQAVRCLGDFLQSIAMILSDYYGVSTRLIYDRSGLDTEYYRSEY